MPRLKLKTRKAFALRRFDANGKRSIFLFTIRNTEDEVCEAFYKNTTADARKMEGYVNFVKVRRNIIEVEVRF